jgi:hypothetical protein
MNKKLKVVTKKHRKKNKKKKLKLKEQLAKAKK